MNFSDIFNNNEIICIIIVIFLTNFLKRFIKLSFIYVYMPLIFSIFCFLVLYFSKMVELNNLGFFVLKVWAGSVLFYDSILKKVEKILNGDKNLENSVKLKNDENYVEKK